MRVSGFSTTHTNKDNQSTNKMGNYSCNGGLVNGVPIYRSGGRPIFRVGASTEYHSNHLYYSLSEPIWHGL